MPKLPPRRDGEPPRRVIKLDTDEQSADWIGTMLPPKPPVKLNDRLRPGPTSARKQPKHKQEED